jgi:hypothetical protein
MRGFRRPVRVWSYCRHQTTEGHISHQLHSRLCLVAAWFDLKRLEMSPLAQLKMILPDRAYAFFSHTHKAQKENMPLLDKVHHVCSFTLSVNVPQNSCGIISVN